MICGTSNLIKLHATKLADIQIKLGEKVLEKVYDPCLLGVKLDQNLKWDNHIKYVLSSCYGKLTVLRKLKNFTPFQLRKNLTESLILSRIDFNDHVYSPLSAIQIGKLQKLQFAAASFVYGGKYVKLPGIIKLRWLPILERREFNLLKLVFKSMHYENWPAINRLDIKKYRRNTRNSNQLLNQLLLTTSLIPGVFQDTASKCYNDLPKSLRDIETLSLFCSQAKKYLLDRAFARSS